MHELGMYLFAIELDYSPSNNKEMAQLITENFGVLCLEEDIQHYEELTFHYNEILNEDFELESRRQEYYDVTGLSLY
jgi:hypothetical protein